MSSGASSGSRTLRAGIEAACGDWHAAYAHILRCGSGVWEGIP
jgi:hypothetical protein